MSAKSEPFHVKYSVASPITRLLNHIIDNVIFIIVSILFFLIFDYLGLQTEERSFAATSVIAIWFFVYYAGFEYYYSKTPGKFITGTIVITEYGQKPDFKTVLIRTFCRLIPFNQLSFLIGFNGEGWHDRFSETLVVKLKKVDPLNSIQKHLIKE